METLLLAFFLLVVYQFKHFFADYILQGEYMSAGKHQVTGWALPLAAHVGVHGLYTFVISALVLNALWAPLGLAVFDMCIHFAMDILKASPSLLGRYSPLDKDGYRNLKSILKSPAYNAFTLGEDEAKSLQTKCEERLRENSLFWWVLGFDQMVHHLTHYAIIFYLVTR